MLLKADNAIDLVLGDQMADFVIAEAALGALEAKHAASSFWTTPIESSVRVGEASRTFLPLNAMTALRSDGHEVRAFTHPMSALGALDEAKRVEVLITRVIFPPGQPNGVAIARTARLKRPGVKILFAALPEMREHTDGLGEFLPAPASPAEIAALVGKMLS